MKNYVLRISFMLVVFLINLGAWGQLSIATIGTASTENFDGMGSSATASLPTGFRIGTDWSTGTTATTQAAGTSGTGILSGTSAGGAYNFANGVTASSTDRAIGFLSSSGYSSPRSVIFAFTNNTGSTVTSIDIAWDYEKYRSGSRAFDWTFFHGSNAANVNTAATSGDQSYAADANNTVISNPPTAISKSFSITGLSIANGTTYYLRWTYTGSGGSTNAQGLAIDNFSITLQAATLCTAPATQASNITFSNITDVSMDLNWTNGSGDGRVVIMNTTNTFTAPTTGANPTANTVYGGSGQQVVYNSTSSGPISISGLAPNTTYWFRAYEYCDPDRVYQTASATGNPSNQATLACLSSTHFFRSVSSGDWNSLSTWESSPNQISWSEPTCVPDFNSSGISIENSHIVTITSDIEVDQVVIQSFGTLRHVAGVLTLRNGPGHDLSILADAVLEYDGGQTPQFENNDVRISVSTSGIIRVTTSVSGLSDNLAGNLSSNRVIYNNFSIFDWNNSLSFASANQNYFPDVNSTTMPIFRISANAGTVGAGTPTIINGILECNGAITWNSAGTKTFRNGITGSGNVTQGPTCGTIIINGEIAFLNGTGIINLNTTPLLVTNNAYLVLLSDKTINTTGTSPAGQIQIDNGTIFDLGIYEISGSGSILINSTATLITSHPNGLDGSLTSLVAVNFVAPYNQDIYFNAFGTQNSGFIIPGACANLNLGTETWLQVVENLTVSNSITMNPDSRITVAAGETLYLSNPAVGALVGGNLVGATNYIHGRLQRATTSGNTYQFPVGFPPYNAQGFTITVTGSGDILGNMEANTSAPLYDYVYCDLETPTMQGQQIGQGLPVPDGILDQMFLDLQSPTQWEITNPGGGITSYDLVLSANGSNDIMPISSTGGTPIRFVMKNGEPGNTGVGTTSTAEFPQLGFAACPNGYTLSGMTSFSTFTINGSSAPNTALPVEFLFFAATVNNQNRVVLNWATASELNNDYFTVERSVDGFSWEIVATVNGNGTTPVRNDYSAIDVRPYSGLSYYRLKQTDFDGAFDYANIVSVFIDGEEKSLIKVVNLIGQEVDLNTRGMVILIFSDGSALKIVNE